MLRFNVQGPSEMGHPAKRTAGKNTGGQVRSDPVEYSLWEFRYADSSQYDLLDLRDKRVELLLRKFHGLNFPIKSKLVGFRFIPYLYEMYGFIYGYYS
jgi:hypothetical protein